MALSNSARNFVVAKRHSHPDLRSCIATRVLRARERLSTAQLRQTSRGAFPDAPSRCSSAVEGSAQGLIHIVADLACAYCISCASFQSYHNAVRLAEG